jgi:hypothetical protein
MGPVEPTGVHGISKLLRPYMVSINPTPINLKEALGRQPGDRLNPTNSSWCAVAGWHARSTQRTGHKFMAWCETDSCK